jgi:hypothetical protein
MEVLLKLVGFGRIVYQPHLIDKGARGIFLACKKHGRAPLGIPAASPIPGSSSPARLPHRLADERITDE